MEKDEKDGSIDAFVGNNDVVVRNLNDKIQWFYINLRSSDKFDELIASLKAIETHIPNKDLRETPELCREIVEDCQKKCGQVIRVPYADIVRNCISASRKKLANKVAKDTDSSQQHGQRHLNTVIELLGNIYVVETF